MHCFLFLCSRTCQVWRFFRIVANARPKTRTRAFTPCCGALYPKKGLIHQPRSCWEFKWPSCISTKAVWALTWSYLMLLGYTLLCGCKKPHRGVTRRGRPVASVHQTQKARSVVRHFTIPRSRLVFEAINRTTNLLLFILVARNLNHDDFIYTLLYPIHLSLCSDVEKHANTKASPGR